MKLKPVRCEGSGEGSQKEGRARQGCGELAGGFGGRGREWPPESAAIPPLWRQRGVCGRKFRPVGSNGAESTRRERAERGRARQGVGGCVRESRLGFRPFGASGAFAGENCVPLDQTGRNGPRRERAAGGSRCGPRESPGATSRSR